MRITLCLFLAGSLGACAGRPSGEAGSRETGTEETAALPGAEPFGADLRARLAAALEAKGAGYVPRTHHLRPDGKPEYTNRLILESSPYLVQHAHNPVNWYPWGDEAFEAAKRQGRPVLLSVGYSTCHWCHVMERESFEDVEIARFLNEHYVAIKVDREQRPDVDAIYMSAVQALTGAGGWPMTVWLTPERAPFYGGTYFPARDGDRGTKVGFLTLLRRLRDQYDRRPEQIASAGRQLTEAIRRSMTPLGEGKGVLPERDVLEAAVMHYQGIFDPINGGPRRAPKFPSDLPVRLLLRHHRRTGDPESLRMAVTTLEHMAHGGIQDHLGGGFHRYATDEHWLVPHFEKMLYDNALLTLAYLEAYQVTKREDLAEVARRILRYVGREMTSPGGGFYSATDADSAAPDGRLEEGRFFTWTPAEIEAALGPQDARVVAAYYGVTAEGNFEGRTILHVARSESGVARELGTDAGGVREILSEARDRLYAARQGRPRPALDDKVLTSWNGLMISAFAAGGRILDDPSDLRRAGRAADFVLGAFRDHGRLVRSYKEGRPGRPAYLDDYAFLIAGLLDLYETTFEPRRLRDAIALQEVLDRHFRDAAGGYFMTADDDEPLPAREKPSWDGAEPSGNSVELMNLLRLHELTTDDRYRAEAHGLLAAFGEAIQRAPWEFQDLLLAVDFWLDRPKEIGIVTPGSREQAGPFLAVLRDTFLPNRVVVVAVRGESLAAQARLVPWLEDKVALGGRATAYVCERGVCGLPTTDASVFAREIRRPDAVRRD